MYGQNIFYIFLVYSIICLRDAIHFQNLLGDQLINGRKQQKLHVPCHATLQNFL